MAWRCPSAHELAGQARADASAEAARDEVSRVLEDAACESKEMREILDSRGPALEESKRRAAQQAERAKRELDLARQVDDDKGTAARPPRGRDGHWPAAADRGSRDQKCPAFM